MSLVPLLEADLAVQIHVIAAVEAIVLLPFALWRKKRDRLHKITGYAWVTNMMVAALSSFWISSGGVVGPFGPIHLLSLLVIFNLGFAIWQVRRRNIRAHQQVMKQTAFWGLGVAGVLTLAPGRIMQEVVFGPATGDATNLAMPLSFVVLGASLGYVALRLLRERRAQGVR